MDEQDDEVVIAIKELLRYKNKTCGKIFIK
jgi:hypothetical protein